MEFLGPRAGLARLHAAWSAPFWPTPEGREHGAHGADPRGREAAVRAAPLRTKVRRADRVHRRLVQGARRYGAGSRRGGLARVVRSAW